MIPVRFDDVDFDEAVKRTAASDRPEGFRRSKQLCEELRRALLATGQIWLREVVVTVHANGRVVLQGRVPTYYLKQLAQSVALAVVGVTALENQIAVE